MDKNELNLIIKTAVEICLNKYMLKDEKSLNLFMDIANETINKYTYDPHSQLNEELFVKQNIINEIDRYMVNKARTDNDLYYVIQDYLMKTLNTTCRIRKEKFQGIEDLDYYKEYAVMKAIETYDETISKSINLYANDWFMAFINKEVDENTKSLILK